jgi:hypothetical protein
MSIPTGADLVRQFVTKGHGLRNDEWSAWWLACQYEMEKGIREGSPVWQGAGRVEKNGRPTAAQYRAADALWHRAIEELRHLPSGVPA